jgi:thymidylate synthase ThyX
VSKQFPIQDGMSEAAYSRAVSAKALDLLRGLLPAASLSHVGIYASGQAYENLVMHLLAHPLPEARSYGQMMLDELKTVIPSFVSRIERPERGGKWIEYLQQRKRSGEWWASLYGIGEPQGEEGPSVRLLHVDGNEDMLLAGLLFEEAGISETETIRRLAVLEPDARAQMIAELAGARENRRHKPGRGLERIRYQFEVVSDYAAFRDLQRHRLLTCQWQKLTPALGAEVPAEVEEARFGDEYRRALEISAGEYDRLAGSGFREEASYACCLGFRMRYTLDMNAREAMHLIELRSGEQGHPSYRAVAQEMHRLIGEKHPAVATMMRHVDQTMEPRLERLLSEIRNEGRNG